MASNEDTISEQRGFRRLSSLFLPPKQNLQKCKRCGQVVYQQERIGPVNEVVFHKQCFKCCVCAVYLTLKNYWSNQGDTNDREIYCQRHAPRIGGSRVDKSAIGIQGAISAQDNFRKSRSHMTELRYEGEQPSYGFNREDLYIKAGMTKGDMGKVGQADHKVSIDGNALHIKGAVDAQLLQRRYQRKLDKHHYPPHIAKKREQLFEQQKKLEEELRKEEDEMFRTFRAERHKEGATINQEIDMEWEKKLKELTKKFEHDMDKRKKKTKDSDKKIMTVQFENEKKDLAATMTLKKEKKKKTMTLRLRQKEQEQTSDLVKKHSHTMLEMLAKEQEELKAQLAREMAHVPSPTVSQNGAAPNHSMPNGQEEVLEEVLEDLPLPVVIQPPSPETHKTHREDMFVDETVFQPIDEQVEKVAKNEQLTYTDLVRQLTECLASDLEKTRAIYRWICVKDLNVMEFDDDLDADTPLGLLRGIKFGTETYHVLFMRLCSYAGLHCEEIKGHSKSVGYEPGMAISEDTFHNTWNAVFVEGDWRLIQCNWGARHLVLSKDKGERRSRKDHIRYQYDEHYFMPDPDNFIQEFWPLEPKWQMLECPITKEEFESLPFVRSIFFHYNMRFDGHKLAVLNTDEKGGAKVAIRIPEELENKLIFFYQLRFADKEKSLETEYRGCQLERFVFQTMVENTVTFSVHVPTMGSYFLEIFANKIEDPKTFEDDNAVVIPFKLKCACKFKIICDSLSGKMHPLPNCAAGEWGPKKALRHFGITPIIAPSSEYEMEKVGMLTVEDNFELKFQTLNPCQFVGKLRMNNVESKILDPFINLTSEDTTMTVYVSLPQIGQYGLDIFARSKVAHTNTLTHACKYLINCTKVESEVHIPKTKNESRRSKFGPMPAFEDMGLTLLSHKEPKIRVGKTNVLFIDVGAPPNVSLSYQCLKEPNEDARDNVTQTKEPNGVVKFVVSMQKKGNYMLSLYARKDDHEDRSSRNVYNFLLQHMPEAGDVDKFEKPVEKKNSLFKKSLFKKSESKDKDKDKDKSFDKFSDRSSDKSDRSN